MLDIKTNNNNPFRPCPFCGEPIREVEGPISQYGRYHVKCEGCGMEFTYETTCEELTNTYVDHKEIYFNILVPTNPPFLEAWNRRANDDR